MRGLVWAALVMLWPETVLVSPASAQTQQLIDMCGNKGGAFSPDRRVEGCAALIDGGRVFGMGRSWAWTNLCSAYNDKKESDRAITYCNQAIEWDPTADAYNNRSMAYYEKGDADRAIADYAQALKLDPKNVTAFNGRARAYYVKGDFDGATRDYNQIIQLDPKESRAYLGRGLAFLYAGAAANALADLNQSNALDPQNAYAPLWIEIVARRSHSASQLAKSAALIDLNKWPAPIVRLYLGKVTPAAVLAAADDPDGPTKKGQLCEANFYSGEWNLQRGKKEEAARLFGLAATDCPKSFLEYGAATAELKGLRASQ